ncbi:MAG: pilus assembly protein [Bacilli bacterium]|nr:pilus assembly protein [Bacilli bacterium]
MNNKGQSLIAFIILLPVIFILITGLWEIGNISYISGKTDKEIKSALKYGLKHIEEENIVEKIKTLLDKNIEAAKEITIGENEIIIKTTYKYKNIYSKYIKPIEINKKYIGKKENNKIIIEKEG